MKKVVLFKEKSNEYEKKFNDRGYDVVFVEPLQFFFINLNNLEAELFNAQYDGLILTSPRAINAVYKCWTKKMYDLWSTKKIYTVGVTSSRKIEEILGLSSLGSSAGNAETLAKNICVENNTKLSLLFPCGNLKSDDLMTLLQTNGNKVKSVDVYETHENENLKKSLIELTKDSSIVCFVFFSPSGYEYVHKQLEILDSNLKKIPSFAIGKTTAKKIEQLGQSVAGVASEPDVLNMIQAVDNFFNTA